MRACLLVDLVAVKDVRLQFTGIYAIAALRLVAVAGSNLAFPTGGPATVSAIS